MNFKGCLHNGNPLGKETTDIPYGYLFYDWETSAIHALGGNITDANGKASLKKFKRIRKKLGLTKDSTDIAAMMAFAETYNGTGYRRFHNRTSSYVVGGTNLLMRGRYVKDSKFNKHKVNTRIGAGAMLLAYSDRNRLNNVA